LIDKEKLTSMNDGREASAMKVKAHVQEIEISKHISTRNRDKVRVREKSHKYKRFASRFEHQAHVPAFTA